MPTRKLHIIGNCDSNDSTHNNCTHNDGTRDSHCSPRTHLNRSPTLSGLSKPNDQQPLQKLSFALRESQQEVQRTGPANWGHFAASPSRTTTSHFLHSLLS